MDVIAGIIAAVATAGGVYLFADFMVDYCMYREECDDHNRREMRRLKEKGTDVLKGNYMRKSYRAFWCARILSWTAGWREQREFNRTVNRAIDAQRDR